MYFRLLEIFILRTLFAKDEYNFTSKAFNPIKLFIILILVGNLIFTIYLLNRLHTIHHIIYERCPELLSLTPEVVPNTPPVATPTIIPEVISNVVSEVISEPEKEKSKETIP